MIFETSGRNDDVEPEFGTGYKIIEPETLCCPLVFSSPHSGDIYPESFLDRTRLSALQLRRSEDAFVDALFADCLRIGAPMIKALFPRTYLDLNREPYELDPRMFEGRLPSFANTRSIRVAGGLGTIPRVVGQAQEIYGRRLSLAEALRRIETLYKPYHARLTALIERAELGYGLAVLIDCHSMPSGGAGLHAAHAAEAGAAKQRADFVLGDRHGASCAAILTEVAEAELRSLGFTVARNKPYAGGYITENYGAPGANRHALQIEVSRGLYMDEQNVTRSERFAEIRAGLRRVAEALAVTAATQLVVHRLAAE
ncbi:N-formylglutamate amidohydrolase [Methylocella silvestris BL2]|uniref:N-formylglutamate amidohydrolase n=1 Tax=Methylocella silvestris (strain DSM 15510 / CIP 108128 / LMG 27833 / NCIMB 13906 / BL2) TaxID=395965 RepID=B8EPJ9_METSB|nr:N-formylglutamate amidohydrolase [Methylocella silvestris]ACK50204.1 N-formylglutamate amidohydrolase [Methylocella silvestris BL2]